MALEGEVEAAEPVAGEGVCAALQDDGRGLVALHDLGHDGHEDVVVAVVVDAVAQREVDRVVLALASADVLGKRYLACYSFIFILSFRSSQETRSVQKTKSRSGDRRKVNSNNQYQCFKVLQFRLEVGFPAQFTSIT